MKRILFVDDEQKILDGLQRLLRPQRQQWEMVFALGAEAAIAELETSCDVIVSDMRMPVVDGARLLRFVKERFPKVVRIVLSGYSEIGLALQTIPVAHQFLSKPCDAEVLKVVVERACGLQSLLADEGIRQNAMGLPGLPLSSKAHTSLMAALEQPDPSLAGITGIVEGSAAHCAKLLQLANSSFFGRGKETTSIQNSISLLGINTLKNPVFATETFRVFGKEQPEVEASLEEIESHSSRTAAIARRLFDERQKSEDALVAGLLHDVGKLVLLTMLPERFLATRETALKNARPFHIVEKEQFGFTHADLGAYLLGLWGLPVPVVDVVARHHAPRRIPPRELDVLAAVQVANFLAHDFEAESGGEAVEPIDPSYLEAMGVADRLPAWRESVSAELRSEGKQLMMRIHQRDVP